MTNLLLSTLKKFGSFDELISQAKPGDMITVFPTPKFDSVDMPTWKAFNDGVVVVEENDDQDSWFHINGELVCESPENPYRPTMYGTIDSWGTNHYGFYVCIGGLLLQNAGLVICKDFDPDAEIATHKDGTPDTSERPEIIRIVPAWQAFPYGFITRKGRTFTQHTFVGTWPNELEVDHKVLGEFEVTHDWIGTDLGVLDVREGCLFLNGERLCVLPDGECRDFRTDGGVAVCFTRRYDELKEYWHISARTKSIDVYKQSPNIQLYDQREDGIYCSNRKVFNGACVRFEPNAYGLIIEANGLIFQLVDYR
ncbi:MAG: hypothetical protein WCV85_00255 [Patescibacteria group bacterium]